MDELDLLTEYNAWVARQKIKDLSPDAFLIDRAKEQALQKLIKISDLLEDKTWEDPLLTDIAEIVDE